MNRYRQFSTRFLYVSAVFFCVCAFHLASSARAASGAQSDAVDLGGKAVDPLKSSLGRAVVLIFVRTDCPISNRYAPTIRHLSAQYAGRATFWLVYPARHESAEMIRKHQQEFGYKLPAIRDLQHTLVRQSHAAITPEAAVFDANRRLIYHGRIDNLYEDFSHARRAPTTHELNDAIQAALLGRQLFADNVSAVGCYISDLE